MIKCFISKVEKAKLNVKRVMAMRGIHPGTSCIQGKAKSEFKRLSDMPGIDPGPLVCNANLNLKLEGIVNTGDRNHDLLQC